MHDDDGGGGDHVDAAAADYDEMVVTVMMTAKVVMIQLHEHCEMLKSHVPYGAYSR